MTLKFYIFYIFIGFILSLGVWILVLFNIDPYKADFMSIAAFFCSMFLWLFCLFSLVGYFLRVWSGNKEVVYTNMPIALRQAFLLSLVAIGLLILQSINVLNWWIAGIWILVILITELYFRARLT